jgi:hypothetical protein
MKLKRILAFLISGIVAKPAAGLAQEWPNKPIAW